MQRGFPEEGFGEEAGFPPLGLQCNMCIDELEAGRKPYCVMACMMRVLDIGPIEEIWKGAFKTTAMGPNDKPVKQVKNMANPELTRPSIAFIPHSKGRVDGK